MEFMQNLRKNLNDYVREESNKVIPHIKSIEKLLGTTGDDKQSYGLGDFLTQKVTCAKAGSAVGAATITALRCTSGVPLGFTDLWALPIAYTIGCGGGYAIGATFDGIYHDIEKAYRKLVDKNKA
jgi:hypothetical protein